MTAAFVKARLEVLRDHLRGRAVDQQQAANTVQEGVECIDDLLNSHEALGRLLKESRQYIELGASSALRDGRSSDVGAVLSGLVERIDAALKTPATI